MRSRLPMGVVALLLTIIAGGSSVAFGMKPSRLTAFAARQNLCDEVCIAIADGRISAWERAEILIGAKQILYPKEYLVFKRALDRVSPPLKKPAAKHPTKPMRKKPASKPRPTARPPAEPSSGPVIPAGAILPDRMASSRVVR